MTSPKRMKASEEDRREELKKMSPSRRRIVLRLEGHDCNDHVVHGYDPESQLGDYYVCGICDELLQVG